MNHNSTAPFFSILIPSYNRPECIAKTIDSILVTSFDDYEIIISDDNSPKHSEIARVLEPYLKADNIRFFKQPLNLREPGNKNFLIQKARGRYNIVIGDDDSFYPEALQTVKNYIERYPLYDMYCFGYSVVDENNRLIYSRQSPKLFEISLQTSNPVKDLFCADMLPLWIFHPNTFCCLNGMEKDLPYRTDVGIGEDMYFLFDVISSGHKMLIIPELIFYWRKVQNLNTTVQINQSLGVRSDFHARKLMYDMLQNKADLNRQLSTYLSTFEYRVRFLYASLVSERRVSRDQLSKVDLTDKMLQELLLYTKGIKFYIVRYNAYLKRLYHYFKIVGIRGLPILLRTILERTYYRLFRQSLR